MSGFRNVIAPLGAGSRAKGAEGSQRLSHAIRQMIITWKEGEIVFIDDTYPHQVWNVNRPGFAGDSIS